MNLNIGVPEGAAAAAELVSVPIGKVRIYDRQRALRPERVAGLAESIAELGLMQPITVWPTSESPDAFQREGVYRLIAGLHRLEACKRLGWTEIPAVLTSAPELNRRLWEIDENLCRAELNELEKSEHLLARQEIYEALYPETRAGVAGGKARQGSANEKISFAGDTAAKTGETDRAIQMSVRRAKKILPEVRAAIRALPAVADSGVELDALARLDGETQRAVACDLTAGKVATVREAVRARMHAEVRGRAESEGADAGDLEELAAAGRSFGVIYADPPWRFETRSAAGQDRAPEAHYPTMTYDRLADMAPQVQGVAASDCALLLWASDPLLPEALRLIEAWGFTFKTVAFTWAKTNPKAGGTGDFGIWHRGLGYWTRANPETCLLATRGFPKRLDRDVDQLIVAPRGAHSAKPEEARKRIERLVAGPYLELFARETHEGWTVWGNEVSQTKEGATQ